MFVWSKHLSPCDDGFASQVWMRQSVMPVERVTQPWMSYHGSCFVTLFGPKCCENLVVRMKVWCTVCPGQTIMDRSICCTIETYTPFHIRMDEHVAQFLVIPYTDWELSESRRQTASYVRLFQQRVLSHKTFYFLLQTTTRPTPIAKRSMMGCSSFESVKSLFML